MGEETATKRLRELLDEQGIEYETNDNMGASETMWLGYSAYQLTPSAKLIMHPTPEQAVSATLGNGTCRIVMTGPGWWECDECGSSIDWDSCDPNDPPSCNYCPNCGRKVVES